MGRILIDTNNLISAIVFDRKELELITRSINKKYKIYISEHIIEETTRVIKRKFPENMKMFEKFIRISKIELIKKKVYANESKEYVDIKDKYDAHVIACASAFRCDFIISGDKDVLSYEHPEIKIMNSADFIKFFNNEEY